VFRAVSAQNYILPAGGLGNNARLSVYRKTVKSNNINEENCE
jgi:hypothetical protein